MERASPPVSPTVVAQIFTTQNIKIAGGALLSVSARASVLAGEDNGGS
jgi:hypothetical protein